MKPRSKTPVRPPTAHPPAPRQSLLAWLLDRLPLIFGVVGSLALLAGLGAYLVLGTLDRVVVVLLAIGVGFWLYALLERPERTLGTLTRRDVRYGSNTLVMSVAFLAILALVNVLANRYTQQVDLTQNQLYTLSPLSVQVIHELKQPVHIIGFFRTGDPTQQQMTELLNEYTKESHLITYEFVDPQVKPGLARQYHVQTFGTTVLLSGTKQQSTTGTDEGSITSALLKLERNRPVIAYYLTGHGELDFTSSAQDGAATAASALTAQNYDLRPLNLAATGKVPADAALVIEAGPTAPLLPQEVTALEQYLDRGGAALFMVDKSSRTALEPLAERYGVQIGNGVVVDPSQSLMNDPLTPLITQYQFSPITKDLPELLFQAATSVTPAKTAPAGYQVQPLAQTTAQSWLATDPKTIQYQQGIDPVGPLDVVVSVAKAPATTAAAATPTTTPAAPNGARIVFVGDVAFATNQMLSFGGGNQTLLTNAADWLTSNQDLIQIQAKVPTDRTMVLSNTQLNVLLYGSSVFLPLLVLAVGIIVWWNRR
jgi:ABC-type uncharacterized transport system involved in gliding motility auxiliary subunit